MQLDFFNKYSMENTRQLFHTGSKIRRLRELKGMKQETLATELGVSRQAVSRIEQSETVEDEMLQKISSVLGVPADAIKHFNEEAVLTIISSTLHDTTGLVNYYPTFNFNPVDKLVELYERLLQAERDKVELLQQKHKNG